MAETGRGLVLWITGLPGSGKSTLAEGLRASFPSFVVLRMDELRKVLTPEPTYTESEREAVYRSIVSTAKILSELGHDVIIDATGNRRRWRDLARRLIPDFAEVYLKCALEVCAEREEVRRDTHGAPQRIYDKAGAGWPVPGVQAPYEAPLDPELTIETDREPVAAALSKLHTFIEGRFHG